MENNKNKKSVKFQGDVLNFCDFIQVFVFTTNHHLNLDKCRKTKLQEKSLSTLQYFLMVKCMTANCQYFIVKSSFFSVYICTNHVNKSALVPFMRVYEVALQNRCGTTDVFGN